jgi:hypothetical protein
MKFFYVEKGRALEVRKTNYDLGCLRKKASVFETSGDNWR